jgi:hypothetical protein
MGTSKRKRGVAIAAAVAAAATATATGRLASADIAPAPTRAALTGRLLVATGDTLGGGPDVLQTLLRTASGTVPLRIPGSQAAQLVAFAGRQVRARGASAPGAFDVTHLALAHAEAVAPARLRSSPAPRAMRIAVVLMRAAGSTANITKRQATHLFFGQPPAQRPGADTPSVASWFSAASGGRLRVSGTVFGTYDARLPANDCNLWDWLRAGRSAVRHDGYSSHDFTNLVVYSPARSCVFASIARVGSGGVFINGNLSRAIVEHELAHNLGLWNAGAYSCSPPVAGCLREHGDPADIMGNARTAVGFSAAHKYMLGWLPSSKVKTVLGGTHDVALTAIDRPGAAGSTALLLVPRKDGTRYAIELRGPAGKTTGPRAAWVRIAGPVGTDDTELRSKPLAAGQSLVDPVNDVTIKTLSTTGRTASLRVCIGRCRTRRPATRLVTPTRPMPATGSPPTTGGPPTTAAPPPAPHSVGAAMTREIVWATCPSVLALTDAQLDQWRTRGVGGFVCQTQHLAGMGGGQEFSADPNAPLAGPRYDLQRQIRDSRIVARAASRGIKLWMGIYLSNYYNPATPLEKWFDDSAWSTQVLPKLGDIAGAARSLGFAGLAFDEEQYDGAAWDWDYPGNTSSEAAVRAEVRARGAQMMGAIVNSFPGVDLLDYGTYFPEGWNALVQQQINHTPDPYAASVQIDLWNGLTSHPGYGLIRFMDATFYKTPHLNGASWDNAMTYNVNRLTAYLSRNLANWTYASSRVAISPFAWIDGDVQNEGSFTAPQDPAYVAAQLAAFRRWGMGGAFSIFSYTPLGEFDYTPYTAGMQAASTPGPTDNQPPAVTVDTVSRVGGDVVISGAATDNMAISSVAWNSGPASGAAPMTWLVTGGDRSTGYQWRMDWTASIPAAPGDVITLTAQDCTGLTTPVTLTAP